MDVVTISPFTCSGLAYSGVSTSLSACVDVATGSNLGIHGSVLSVVDLGIDELGHAFRRDQDIARIQVPVDDSVLVSNMYRSANLAEEREPRWDIQPVCITILVDSLTFDVFRQKGRPSVVCYPSFRETGTLS